MWVEYRVLFVVDFSLIKYIEVCEIFDGYFVDCFIDNLIGDFGIYIGFRGNSTYASHVCGSPYSHGKNQERSNFSTLCYYYVY